MIHSNVILWWCISCMKPFNTNLCSYSFCLIIHNKPNWQANQSKNLMQMYCHELINHSDELWDYLSFCVNLTESLKQYKSYMLLHVFSVQLKRSSGWPVVKLIIIPLCSPEMTYRKIYFCLVVCFVLCIIMQWGLVALVNSVGWSDKHIMGTLTVKSQIYYYLFIFIFPLWKKFWMMFFIL